MLSESDTLSLQSGDAAEPGSAFGQELVSWHVRILGAQPVCHDPQAVERGLIEVGTLQAADEFECVHASHGQYF